MHCFVKIHEGENLSFKESKCKLIKSTILSIIITNIENFYFKINILKVKSKKKYGKTNSFKSFKLLNKK